MKKTYIIEIDQSEDFNEDYFMSKLGDLCCSFGDPDAIVKKKSEK